MNRVTFIPYIVPFIHNLAFRGYVFLVIFQDHAGLGHLLLVGT